MVPFPSEILSEIYTCIRSYILSSSEVPTTYCTSLKQTSMSRNFAQDEIRKWNMSEDTIRFDKIFHFRMTLIAAL
jgi:hypothetical protein